MNPFIYSITTKIIKEFICYYNKNEKKKSSQDGCQMVEVKFNPNRLISHYCNNRFALQYVHIHNFYPYSKHA